MRKEHIIEQLEEQIDTLEKLIKKGVLGEHAEVHKVRNNLKKLLNDIERMKSNEKF